MLLALYAMKPHRGELELLVIFETAHWKTNAVLVFGFGSTQAPILTICVEGIGRSVRDASTILLVLVAVTIAELHGDRLPTFAMCVVPDDECPLCLGIPPISSCT